MALGTWNKKLLVVLLTLLCCGYAAAKPLKVYILVGQSNMQGHGHRSTLSYMNEDPKTKPLYSKIIDQAGKDIAYKDVPIIYWTGKGGWGKPMTPSSTKGFLSVGYGGVGEGTKVGPELGFGITMREALKEPFLIIKTAWGGKSLNTDFRPPSAGPYQLSQKIKELWAKHPKGAHGVPSAEKRKEWWDKKNKATGFYYRQMVKHVKETLDDIKKVYPSYDEKQRYEIAGFVWFQGWNDMCDGGTYPEGRNGPEGYAEYSRLMACFIRDVRKEFKAPKMPFVIGVIGVGGDKAQGGIANLRPAMAAPAKMDEFKGTVAAVQTGDFWDHKMDALMSKKGMVDHRLRAGHVIAANGMVEPREDNRGWQAIGTLATGKSVWQYAAVEPAGKDIMEKKGKKRYRQIVLPAELKDWYKPEFDVSKWKSGKAPIGVGKWKHRQFPEVKYASDWGEGEFLLMRTTFVVENLDFVKYRIAVLSRQGFAVYLNGKKIHTYIWWKDEPFYRSIELGEDHAKLLKKGKNVLAVYGGVEYDRRSQEPFNAIDIMLEGITKEGLEYVQSSEYKFKLMDKVCTREEGKIMMGASNGGYHYLGSGKMLTQIGEAFAKALLKMQR